MFTAAFAKASAERAVKTFAQTLAATLAVAAGFESVDWVTAASTAGLAALLSVLTSVASSQVGGPGPSVVDAEMLYNARHAAFGYGSGVRQGIDPDPPKPGKP